MMLFVLLAVVACGVFVVSGHVKRLAAAVEAQNQHYGVGAWNDDVASLLASAKVVVYEFGGTILETPEGNDLRDAIRRVEGGPAEAESAA